MNPQDKLAYDEAQARLTQARRKIAILQESPDVAWDQSRLADALDAAESAQGDLGLAYGEPPIIVEPPVIDPQPPSFEWEAAIFAKGAGFYGWLKDADLEIDEKVEMALDGASQYSASFLNPTGWQMSTVFQAPAAWSDRNIMGNNVLIGGQYGPKWGGRIYNLSGAVRKLKVQRMGWWGDPKPDGSNTGTGEGHGFYADLLEDFLLEDYAAIQCAGQGVQLTQYADPTYSAFPFTDPAKFHNKDFTVTLRRVRIKDCGIKHTFPLENNTWDKVGRGSNPISIFNPGQKVVLEDVLVEVNHAVQFIHPQKGLCASTGALLVSPGKKNFPTPSLLVTDLRTRLGRPDREDVRLVRVMDAEFRDLDLQRADDSGLPELAVYTSCGQVRIKAPKTDINLTIRDAQNSGKLLNTIKVAKGTDYTLG